MIDHATSDVYKAATAKLKVECSRARGATSTTIERFFVFDGRHTTEDGEEVRCVFHGKENLLFTKYPALLELESHHGVDLGPSVPHARLSEGLY